ncbi:hypothetical protein ACOXXX_18280 [Thalassococcus sp. BH17M4-6]|uniref:hypothetical protein n=1 Tax=Thalassococcus sp. BH17M4-6 TaxID=3413148 RepID=UPI003BC87876
MIHPLFPSPFAFGLVSLGAALTALPATAQDVFSNGVTISDSDTGSAALYVQDDTVLDDQVCMGFSCVRAESFSTDYTLKINWSRPSIQFIDSSTDNGTLPFRDWRLEINSTLPFSNGGREYFAVRDLDNNSVPFLIEGGTRSNALYVQKTGNIGLGTMLPQANLHIADSGGDPGIRFEDTGFSPYSWYLSGDSSGFYVSNPQTLDIPFEIRAGAPDSALHIFYNGNIGLGTAAPNAALHVARSDNTARVLVEDTGASGAQELFKLSNNGGSYFTFENTDAGTTWFFTHEDASPNRFIIADAVADGPEMSLTADGDLTIPGQLFTAGSCAAGCDRVFDADYPLPTIAEQAAMMRDLKHLPAVGPTPEDGPFNITAMTGGMLNELEKAHLYIAELEARDRALAAENHALQLRVARIEALLTRRESR